MATVNLSVQFGFNKNAAGEYVYNDITDYVMSVTFGRGKGDQLATYDAGVCTVVLQNRSRAFDPSYGDSPFAGQIVPTGGLKVVINNIEKFVGFIDDWSLSFDVDGNSIASVSAFDAMAKLNVAPLVDYAPTIQLSSARVNNVLTTIGWPASKRAISTGAATVDDTVVNTDSALSYLQQVEASEQGRLFVDGAGNVVFRSRYDGFYESSYTEYRYNLCVNPGFESNTTGWNGAVTRSTAQFYNGTASGSVTAGSAVSTTFIGDANTIYSLSLYARPIADGTVTILGLAGTANTTEASASTPVTAGVWTRCSLTYTSLDSIHAMQVVPSTGTFIDAVLIEDATTVLPYFDGTIKPANTSTTTYTSSWDI